MVFDSALTIALLVLVVMVAFVMWSFFLFIFQSYATAKFIATAEFIETIWFADSATFHNDLMQIYFESKYSKNWFWDSNTKGFACIGFDIPQCIPNYGAWSLSLPAASVKHFPLGLSDCNKNRCWWVLCNQGVTCRSIPGT